MKRSLDLGDTRSQKCIVYSAPFLKSLHRSKDWQRLAQAATVERIVLLFSFRLFAHFPSPSPTRPAGALPGREHRPQIALGAPQSSWQCDLPQLTYEADRLLQASSAEEVVQSFPFAFMPQGARVDLNLQKVNQESAARLLNVSTRHQPFTPSARKRS